MRGRLVDMGLCRGDLLWALTTRHHGDEQLKIRYTLEHQRNFQSDNLHSTRWNAL